MRRRISSGHHHPKPDPCGDAEQSEPAPGVGCYSNADALVDVARGFLATAPQDRSGEDRTLVVVHVSADNLTREGADVPAGTSQPAEAVCHLAGVGPVEPATAQRLACDNRVLGAVVDKRGQVLALGRTRRLVSKAQRRALLIRDRMCRYPGCHSTRHLKAHHVVPWILGGRTDLDNLILLCQWHPTAVHEGGVSITQGPDGWVFTKPDGQPCDWWVSDENLARHLDSRYADANKPGIGWLRWTASTTPTPERSGRAGPENPSTSTRASKPSSPSNSPSGQRILINKPHRERDG
jgi:hypothetical protein